MCGKTSKESGQIGSLACGDKECHCYGNICLVGKTCSEGHVYVSGTPVCNTLWGKHGRTVTCKALGFIDQEKLAKKKLV